MRKVYSIPLGWFIVYMALVTALCASALTLALLCWPVATGVVLALAVSVAMLVCTYQIVTSGSQHTKPPARDAAATVDASEVTSC